MTLPSRRALLLAGVIALAILALAGAGWAWYGHQQRQVQQTWAQTLSRVQDAQAPQATAEQRAAATRDLEEFLARHASAAVVPQAAFDLGNLRFAAGQYPAARAAWEIVLARAGPATLRPLARLSIAAAWEAERDFAKALDAYAALAKDLVPGHFLFEETLMDLARAQELAGRKTEAVATYRRLLKDVPAGRHTDEVRIRLASLGLAFDQ